MDLEKIRSGELLPVLECATHEELKAVVSAINKALDVFITWDRKYSENVNDLTKIPDLIGSYLCMAGGHTIRNKIRGGGPEYAIVVRDVCEAMKVKPLPKEMPVTAMEENLLKTLLEKIYKSLTPKQKEDLLKTLVEKAGEQVNFDKLLQGGGAILASIAPTILAFVAEQAAMKGVLAIGQAALARLVGGVAGPLGLVVGVLSAIHEISAPSLRGTIPAVVQVAIIRLRVLSEELP